MAFNKTVELKESFEICGLKTRTKNADEMSEGGKIANLWQEFLSSSYNGLDEIYAVYCDYESDFDGLYTLCVGTKTPPRGIYEKVRVNGGKYALFSKEGTGGDVTMTLWGEIWQFFKSSNLKRAYKSDFEKYSKDKVEIYISIK